MSASDAFQPTSPASGDMLSAAAAAIPQCVPEIPPLVNGDRLSRAEFQRRYEAMPHVKKAELIEGVVYMPSPVSADGHGSPHFNWIGWLLYYQAHTPCVQGNDNATIRLDHDNEYQPDALLRILEQCGGSTRLINGFIHGPPEWVGEVSNTSTSHDLHGKKNVYRRAGVQEYAVWRVYDRQVDWFRLQRGEFVEHPPDAGGIYRSAVFPGLWLDVPALLAGNARRVLAVVQQGIDSPEHARFARQLSSASPPLSRGDH